LPYQLSLLAWVAVTASVYFAAVYSITGSLRSLMFAAVYPVALVTVIYGQNAFLTAGLIGLALSTLNTNPLLAGFLIGTLTFKPQLGLAFPIVLLFSGRWPAFFSATLSTAASVALSILLFGVNTWESMLDVSALTRATLLDQGQIGFEQIETLFGALRYFNVPLEIAYATQALLTTLVAIGLIHLWRSPVQYEIKAAGCITGTLLMTPYLLPYDLLLLVPAAAFLVRQGLRDGFHPYERAVIFLTLLAAVGCVLALRTPLFLAGPAGVLSLFLWTISQTRIPQPESLRMAGSSTVSRVGISKGVA
jgi:hypothetical protein